MKTKTKLMLLAGSLGIALVAGAPRAHAYTLEGVIKRGGPFCPIFGVWCPGSHSWAKADDTSDPHHKFANVDNWNHSGADATTNVTICSSITPTSTGHECDSSESVQTDSWGTNISWSVDADRDALIFTFGKNYTDTNSQWDTGMHMMYGWNGVCHTVTNRSLSRFMSNSAWSLPWIIDALWCSSGGKIDSRRKTTQTGCSLWIGGADTSHQMYDNCGRNSPWTGNVWACP